MSALTLPFRNAYSNTIPDEENKAQGFKGLWRLTKQDWNNIGCESGEYDAWLVEKDNKNAPEPNPVVPVVGSHAVMAQLGQNTVDQTNKPSSCFLPHLKVH